MSTATVSKAIRAVGEDRVCVSGDVTLGELYEAMPGVELCVEPLSASQALGEWLVEGGLGWGSSQNGTFGGQICSVRGGYGGTEFTYGLGTTPLYNTGYPLQRIMEGRQSDLLGQRFGVPSEMVVRTRRRAGRAFDHSAADGPDIRWTGGSVDKFFANGAAAKAIGLPGAGIVKARRIEDPGAGVPVGEPSDAWTRRHVLDSLPEGHGKLLVLSQPSGASELYAAHKAGQAEGLFLALAVHLGILVLASAPAAGIEELARKADGLPLTWRLGA